MMNGEGRFSVVVGERAEAVLVSVGGQMAAKLYASFEELEIDPRSHELGGRSWWNAKAVGALHKRGYPFYRVSAYEIKPLRVLYFIDEPRRRVLICDIVEKDDNTYEPGAEHIRAIIRDFLEYRNLG